MKYLTWAFSIIFWDGVLPLLVLLLPGLVHRFLDVGLAINLSLMFFVPFAFFFARGRLGLRRMAELSSDGMPDVWRIVCFVPALILIATIEALVVAASFLSDGLAVERQKIMTCYLVYLALVAVAFFPGPPDRESASRQNENPWKSLGHGE